MGDAVQFVLYEHAVGYALVRINEFEDAGQIIPEVQEAIADPSRFCAIVKLEAFDPFKNTEAALDNCNAVSEGLLHADLLNFLDQNVPKAKKKKNAVVLGVGDSKLAGAISEAFAGQIRCSFTGPVPEILRGVRMHFARLAKDLPHHSLSKAQLSLGHSYSRAKVKFDVHRVDNMVIQAIALLDQLDKDINLFGMRIREWYSYHFPELFKVVPDQYKYVRCASIIMDRKNLDDEAIAKLMAVLDDDEEKVAAIVEAARTSMGMDISAMDMLNIERFAARVAALTEYRVRLHQYVKDRMHSCAPSLSALIGEQVGARLISHAGSLTNLAKYPASTVQILGAEKALFRALKTRSNTPKYGLLFHSTFIGRASMKNKGRISRFLANKCSIASRIDCFSEVPVAVFGEHLRQQVEDRLKYFETGTPPAKNLDVMHAAEEAAVGERQVELRKRRKAAKRARKSGDGASGEKQAGVEEQVDAVVVKKMKKVEVAVEEAMELDASPTKRSRKMKKEVVEMVETVVVEELKKSKRGRKSSEAMVEEEASSPVISSEKKKKKHKAMEEEEMPMYEEEEQSAKKQKKKQMMEQFEEEEQQQKITKKDKKKRKSAMV